MRSLESGAHWLLYTDYRKKEPDEARNSPELR